MVETRPRAPAGRSSQMVKEKTASASAVLAGNDDAKNANRAKARVCRHGARYWRICPHTSRLGASGGASLLARQWRRLKRLAQPAAVLPDLHPGAPDHD